MYAAIRNYPDAVPNVVAEIKAREPSLSDAMKAIDGIVDYHLVETPDGRVVTIGLFADRAGADESTRVAGMWVKENIPEWVPNPPTVTQGTVALTTSS